MYNHDNVAFVLVPGSFSTPYLYHKVTAQLRAQGYTVAEVPLTSASDGGKQIPPKGMHDDAVAIHNACTALLESGKNVIVAMNSYGGIPGSESVRGLSQVERGTNATAVTGLVYIAAMLVPEGMSVNQKLSEISVPGLPGKASDDEEKKAALVTSDQEDPHYMHHFDPDMMRDFAFSDIADISIRQHYYDTMPVQSKISFEQEMEYAGWKVIRSTYILCEEDMIIAPDAQRDMIEKADGVLGVGKEIKVVSLKSGHVPMVSRPDDVVRILLGAAGIGQAQ